MNPGLAVRRIIRIINNYLPPDSGISEHDAMNQIIACVDPYPGTEEGQRVVKIKGSQWHGYVVGYYSTELTPDGYCVESEYERGSVQIYPAAALRVLP